MATERDLLIAQFELEEELLRRAKGRMIDTFYSSPAEREAYAAHTDIFRAGKDFRERAAFGGNRVGKTTLGAYETALHLTGQYPPHWTGHRFDRPIEAWACGVNLSEVLGVNQAALLGKPHAIGTGMIPADAIVDKRRKSGVPDLYDTVTVKHISGGHSTLQFKPTAAGRETFQGRKIQFIWMDEEPEWPVYEEMIMRTIKTGEHDNEGKMLITMTPMKGLSQVAEHFLQDGHLLESDNRYAHLIGWEDIPHLSEETKADILASIPRHQREARTQGYPSLGTGAIFIYSEDALLTEPFTIPMFYQRAYGLDVGWKATAAVFIAKDPDSGAITVYDEYKRGEETATVHAAVIKLKADSGDGMLTGAIDPASRGRSQLDGKNLMREYQQQGLKLYPAENAVTAGLHKIQMLIDTGQLKIYSKCTGLLAEMRQYHRDDKGKVIKRNDHLIDALRYAVATERIHIRPTTRKPRKAQRFGWTK